MTLGLVFEDKTASPAS